MKRTNSAVWMDDRSRWRIVVQKDGHRKAFYSSVPGRAGQREANAKADAWLDDGIDHTDRRVKDLYAEYVAEIKETTSYANALNIENIGDVWIIPYIGKKRISAITENELQLILNRMHKEGRAKKTIANTRAAISQFFKYCRRIKVTTLNPEFLEIPKGAYSKKKRILEPDSLKTLFTQPHTRWNGKIIEDPLINAYRFSVSTGLRPGELLGLEWADVFDGVVHVQRSLNIHGQITNGKNANAIRNFALNDLAAGILMDQLEALTGVPAHLWDDVLLGKKKFAANGNALVAIPTGRVFPCSNERYYFRRWVVYCEHNNIPRVSPYELRHTFVSIVKDLPEGMIKGLVGHSQNMDTLGIYSHQISGEMQLTAANVSKIFDALLADKKEKEAT